MDNKTLWIMCGAPGSGKTWFAKNKLEYKNLRTHIITMSKNATYGCGFTILQLVDFEKKLIKILYNEFLSEVI